MSARVHETAVNMISEGSRIEGKITLDHLCRINGILVGEVKAKDGTTLILSETGVIEGDIEADTLMIDGYVRGDIVAKSRVVISRTGRVIGNIKTPSLSVEFGAYFEGRCVMEGEPLTSAPVLSPA